MSLSRDDHVGPDHRKPPTSLKSTPKKATYESMDEERGGRPPHLETPIAANAASLSADNNKCHLALDMVNGEASNRSSVLSSTPEKTPGTVSRIPDGGFTAWCQVLGSFFLFFNCWGIVNTFGDYQTYYTTSLAAEATPSQISWIGSLQAFLLFALGVLSGPLFDMGYFRTLIMLGCFLSVFGMMMTSLCSHYWQVMLAQGLTIGLGSGCLFVPSVSIIPTYFSTKKALAQGIAASGSAVGGVIYPIVFRQLQPLIGFAWATRVLGLIMLLTLVPPLAGMKMRLKSPARRNLFDTAALKDTSFMLFSIGAFFGFMGTYIPFFYLSSYAIEQEITNDTLGFYLLAIMNAGSTFGRIIPNFAADYLGCFNVLIPTSLISCLLAFAWIGIHDPAGLIVFAILYGFFSGAFISLPPPTIVTLSPSLDVVGTWIGMSGFFASIGLLVGTPIAGAILEHGGWAGLQAWGASCIGVATIFITAARVAKAGWNLDKRI